MKWVGRFLKRHSRRLVAVGIAGVVFVLWVSFFTRFLGVRPRLSINLVDTINHQLAPDGKTIAAVSYTWHGEKVHHTLCLWDAYSGEHLFATPCGVEVFRIMGFAPARFTHRFSPSGRRLAYLRPDNSSVCVLDVARRSCQYDVPFPWDPKEVSHGPSVQMFSPDERYLIVHCWKDRGPTTFLVDLESSTKQVRALPYDVDAFTPDCRCLVYADPKQPDCLVFWNIKTENVERVLAVGAKVSHVVYSSTGRFLCVTSYATRIFDATNLREVMSFRTGLYFHFFQFTSDDQSLVTLAESGDDPRVRLWDTKTWVERSWPAELGNVSQSEMLIMRSGLLFEEPCEVKDAHTDGLDWFTQLQSEPNYNSVYRLCLVDPATGATLSSFRARHKFIDIKHPASDAFMASVGPIGQNAYEIWDLPPHRPIALILLLAFLHTALILVPCWYFARRGTAEATQ